MGRRVFDLQIEAGVARRRERREVVDERDVVAVPPGDIERGVVLRRDVQVTAELRDDLEPGREPVLEPRRGCPEVAGIGESVRVNDSPSSSTLLCSSMSLLARGLCLLCTIGTNALMIGSFLDGMNESGSVVGTALSTAANFSCSVSTQRPGGECARIRLRTRDAENHVAATSINIGTFVR